MTFPLHELRRLLGEKREASYGVVVSISSGTAKVATEGGAVFATAGPGVQPGARVKILAGVAQLAPASSATYQV